MLLWLLIKELATGRPVQKKRAVQEISLLKPPPPPPPPKVAPPPPPKVEVEKKMEVREPDQQPDKPAQAPPPGPDLAVDAQGTGEGDGFGLVGKKGGADLIGGDGGGGAGAGSRFAWYGALVKERIQERVQEMTAKDKKKREDFKVTVNVWVNGSGVVTRAELVDSTGNTELDGELKAAFRGLPALREGAPTDMPQPIKLRITVR